MRERIPPLRCRRRSGGGWSFPHPFWGKGWICPPPPPFSAPARRALPLGSVFSFLLNLRPPGVLFFVSFFSLCARRGRAGGAGLVFFLFFSGVGLVPSFSPPPTPGGGGGTGPPRTLLWRPTDRTSPLSRPPPPSPIFFSVVEGRRGGVFWPRRWWPCPPFVFFKVIIPLNGFSLSLAPALVGRYGGHPAPAAQFRRLFSRNPHFAKSPPPPLRVLSPRPPLKVFGGFALGRPAPFPPAPGGPPSLLPTPLGTPPLLSPGGGAFRLLPKGGSFGGSARGASPPYPPPRRRARRPPLSPPPLLARPNGGHPAPPKISPALSPACSTSA